MKPFILRRLKTEVLQSLPKKYIHFTHCQMAERQLKEYKDLINGYVKRSEQIVKAAQNDKTSQLTKESPNNIIMELRKAANHPLLRRAIYTDEKIKEMAKKVMTVREVLFKKKISWLKFIC
jgi:SWI/SNF-related matrix-associated actin-dependent regulator 1 of chromatin subfamily A